MKRLRSSPLVILWLAMALLTLAGTRTEVGNATLQSTVRVTNNTGATVTNSPAVIPLSTKSMLDAALIDTDTLDITLQDSAGNDIPFWPANDLGIMAASALCDDDGGGGAAGDVCQTDGTLITDRVDVIDAGASDVQVFTAATPVVDDGYYFCGDQQFGALHINVGQAGVAVTDWVLTWEYRNSNDVWTTLPELIDGTDGFRNLGTNVVSWKVPADMHDDWLSWQVVDGLDTAGFDWSFCVRMRVIDAGTGPYVEPLLTQVFWETAVGNVVYTAADNTSDVSTLYVNFTDADARGNFVEIFETGIHADSRVVIPAAAQINNRFASIATIEFWMYARSDGESNRGMVVSKYSGSGGGTGWYAGPATQSTTGVLIRFHRTFNVINGEWTSTQECPLATWCHVAIAYDESDVSNVPIFTLDGIEDATTITISTPAGSAESDSALDLWIGNYNGLAASHDGYVDDLRIWSDLRSEAEILANKDNDLVGNETGLVALYLLNDRYGAEADDAHSSDNDGDMERAMWESDSKLQHVYIPPSKDSNRPSRTGFTSSGTEAFDQNSPVAWRGYTDFGVSVDEGSDYLWMKQGSAALKTGTSTGQLDFLTWTSGTMTTTELVPSGLVEIDSSWTAFGCTVAAAHQCLDEGSTPDDDTTYLEDASGAASEWTRLVVNIGDIAGGGDDVGIARVTMTIRGRSTAGTPGYRFGWRVGEDGAEYNNVAGLLTFTGSYANTSSGSSWKTTNSITTGIPWTPSFVENLQAYIDLQGTAAAPARITGIWFEVEHRQADENITITGLSAGEHEINVEHIGSDWVISVDHEIKATQASAGAPFASGSSAAWLFTEGGNAKWMRWASTDDQAGVLFERVGIDNPDAFDDENTVGGVEGNGVGSGIMWLPLISLDTSSTVSPFVSTVVLEASVQESGTGELVDDIEGDIEGVDFANTIGPSSKLPGYAFISAFAAQDNLPIIFFYNIIWIILMILIFLGVLIIAPAGGSALFIAALAAGLWALLGIGVNVVEPWFLMIYGILVVVIVLLKEKLPI